MRKVDLKTGKLEIIFSIFLLLFALEHAVWQRACGRLCRLGINSSVSCPDGCADDKRFG